MSDAPPSAPLGEKPGRAGDGLRRSLPGLGRGVLRVLRRGYALALILLICYLTWRAIGYLIISLAVQSAPPPQITALPTRLDPAVLGTPRSAWQALDAAEHPRSPLAHYHRLDGWLQPDRFNDCTRSGCHGPLPHARRKEVRAFLNLHATSIHCGVCHMKSDREPLPVTWYGLESGQACQPPSALRAYELLTASGGPPDSPDASARLQEDLVRLIAAAAEEANKLPALRRLADHFAAVRPGSEAFKKLWEAARSNLPRHFRGEYGAKLALRDERTGEPVLGHPGTDEAVRRYLERSPRTDARTLEKLLTEIHPMRRDKPLHCTDCHNRQGGLVGFRSAGYPAARIDGLVQPIIFRMIEHINSGQPMHMPQFLQPTTRPAG